MKHLVRRRLAMIAAINLLCAVAGGTEAQENRFAEGNDLIWQLIGATVGMGYRCHESGVSLDACLAIAKSVFGRRPGLKGEGPF